MFCCHPFMSAACGTWPATQAWRHPGSGLRHDTAHLRFGTWAPSDIHTSLTMFRRCKISFIHTRITKIWVDEGEGRTGKGGWASRAPWLSPII